MKKFFYLLATCSTLSTTPILAMDEFEDLTTSRVLFSSTSTTHPSAVDTKTEAKDTEGCGALISSTTTETSTQTTLVTFSTIPLEDTPEKETPKVEKKEDLDLERIDSNRVIKAKNYFGLTSTSAASSTILAPIDSSSVSLTPALTVDNTASGL